MSASLVHQGWSNSKTWGRRVDIQCPGSFWASQLKPYFTRRSLKTLLLLERRKSWILDSRDIILTLIRWSWPTWWYEATLATWNETPTKGPYPGLTLVSPDCFHQPCSHCANAECIGNLTNTALGCFLISYCPSYRSTFDSLRDWLNEYSRYSLDENVPRLLVG